MKTKKGKWRKIVLYVVTAILLFNPITVAYALYYLGIGFDWETSRNKKVITNFSSAVPPLPKDAFYFPIGPSDNGGFLIGNMERKPITIYDDNQNKLIDIIPGPEDRNLEYEITEDKRFIATGNVFKSAGANSGPDGSWVRFPEMKVILYNRDGSILTGPYENEILYKHYVYKDGKWQRFAYFLRYSSLEEAEREEKRIADSKATADYYVWIPGGHIAETKNGRTRIAHTFEIRSNKQYQKKPQRFLFTNNIYPWDIGLKYEGIYYQLHFTTIKDPPDLLLYPLQPDLRY